MLLAIFTLCTGLPWVIGLNRMVVDWEPVCRLCAPEFETSNGACATRQLGVYFSERGAVGLFALPESKSGVSLALDGALCSGF